MIFYLYEGLRQSWHKTPLPHTAPGHVTRLFGSLFKLVRRLFPVLSSDVAMKGLGPTRGLFQWSLPTSDFYHKWAELAAPRRDNGAATAVAVAVLPAEAIAARWWLRGLGRWIHV